MKIWKFCFAIYVLSLLFFGCHLSSEEKQTPTAADYDIGSLTRTEVSVSAVTITPKQGKSTGTVTIYYEGTGDTSYSKTTDFPTTVGYYVVTFNVAAATGWNAVSNINAGTLVIYDYTLGSIGPGGGKIFYYNEIGFTMTDNEQVCHFLEAALENMPTTLAWASFDYTSTTIPGTETVLGTGRKNTAIILATDANAPAAKACKEYFGGGLNDWFFPSKDELSVLNTNKASVGNMGTYYYWSSSQYDNNTAWWRNFSSGRVGNSGKNISGSFLVRPIRAF